MRGNLFAERFPPRLPFQELLNYAAHPGSNPNCCARMLAVYMTIDSLFAAKARSHTMWDSRILTLGDSTVLVECGPMRMFLDGSLRGIRRPEPCQQAGRKAIGFLEEIASDRSLLKGPAVKTAPPAQGRLSRVMWEACHLMGDDDLTPMAAVAGTLADATADFLEAEGLTRVIVNNGGDIAVRLGVGETVVVGIRQEVNLPNISHRLTISQGLGIRGVCTSGLGGRSFTRGVASAATVLAGSAALADAAATSVANATCIQSPAVRRTFAHLIDPETDLKGVQITYSVSALTDREVQTALSQGVDRAETLVASGLIQGACVSVQGRSLSVLWRKYGHVLRAVW